MKKINQKTKFLISAIMFLFPLVVNANLVPDPITIAVYFGMVIGINAFIEILVSLAILIKWKITGKFRILFFVALANLISYPLFSMALHWSSFTMGNYFDINFFSLTVLVVLEILVVFFETFIIFEGNKQIFTWPKSLKLSVFNNIATIFAGAIFYFLFGIF